MPETELRCSRPYGGLEELRFFCRASHVSAGTSYGPLSVSVYVCHKSAGVLLKRLNESGWFWAWKLRSSYPTLCCKEIRVSPKISVLPSATLLQPNSGLREFRHGMSVVETCRQQLLSSRKVDAESVINWTVVGQLIDIISELRRSTSVVSAYSICRIRICIRVVFSETVPKSYARQSNTGYHYLPAEYTE